MQLNGVNSTQTAQKTSFGSKSKEPKVKVKATEDSISIFNGEGKPKFGKSFGKGFLYKLANTVPVFGSYLIGKNIIEQDNIQDALANGTPYENKEPGIIKSVIKGAWVKIAQSIPAYGTYRIGKEIVEQKNIQEALKTGNKELAAKKPGFVKSWWEGAKMKIYQSIPILGTYKFGKEVETHKVINDQLAK